MEDIQNNKPKHVIKKIGKRKDDLKHIEEIVFDQNDRFFICKSNASLVVVNYSQLGLPGYEPNVYRIDL